MRLRVLAASGSCLALVIVGCAAPKVAPKTTNASTSAAPATTPAVVSLVVHDPTDVQGRLALKLQAALAPLGVTAHIVAERKAATDPFVVEVEVLNRQRQVDDVKHTKREGTRTASGFGLISGADDPINKPEQHDGPREKFDYGKVQEQSDLRLILTATLSRLDGGDPIAKWDDTEGTLIPRATDGTQPVLHPWQALYGAAADKLAGQVRAALPK
ncbi:MAG TPA: hypothetical protein VIA18_26570 [Polyangia bacterium]|jgi:hypothetical protein|nr:hypothetical protein [Polyangia bacterium]